MPRHDWSNVTYEPINGNIEEIDIWTRGPNRELIVRPGHQTSSASIPPVDPHPAPVWWVPPVASSPAVQWLVGQPQTGTAEAPVINNTPSSAPINVHDFANAASNSAAIASIEFNGQRSNLFSANGPYPDPYWWHHVPHHPPLESEEAIVRAHVLAEENDKKNASEQAVQKYKLELAEAEKVKQRIINEHELEMKNKEEDTRRLKDFWEAQQKAEQLKKENEKKKQEEDLKNEMRKKMVDHGFGPDEIEQAISGKPYHPTHHLNPVPYTHSSSHAHQHSLCADLSCPGLGLSDVEYVRVRWEQLNTETLDYFGIPWKFDSDDREVILILRPKSSLNIQDLFSHTREHYDFDVLMRVWKRKAVIEVRPTKKKKKKKKKYRLCLIREPY
ncbi:hypothetical protein PV08_07373 [Exophiala spinifera]|uniref:Uncharacterized protein n=1 Tax=Exophiala spinifera TaxID=91928 RepID=A0A0D2BTN1_9EURO|nr:uncharacterized protein PV08_07373 [Exophiala spinifera]KIW14589.1 hypothetical protein PV08_07373 [Exophiala spinifera]